MTFQQPQSVSNMMPIRQALQTIQVFSLAGIGLSIYSLLTHLSISTEGACVINETFNCDLVNKSEYAEIAGIPVALIGVLGYVFLLVASSLKRRDLSDRSLTRLLLGASFGAVLFSLYLTALEAFVIYAWCIVCLTSLAVIVTVFGTSVTVWRHDQR